MDTVPRRGDTLAPTFMSRRRSASGSFQRTLVRLIPAVLRLVGGLSRPATLALGRGLGRFGFRFATKARRSALRNLEFIYPNLPAEARRRLAVRCFEHWGMVTLDFLRCSRLDKAKVLELVTEVDGVEEHADPVLASGRGIVAVGAHLGAIDLFGRFAAARGVKLTVVTRDPDQPEFRALVKELRESGGYQTVDRQGGASLRKLLTALRSGEVVGILPDQNADDLFVPFFGAPAGVADGAAELALRTGAAVVPAFCLRNSDGSYRIVVRPPILPDPDALDRQAEVRRITEAFTREFEAIIRTAPEQYLWLHNRWKGAFEPRNREKWPSGFDYDALKARWESGG